MRGRLPVQLLYVVVLGFLLATVTRAAEDQVKKLSPDDLKAIIDGKAKLFFLDVREPKEIERLGTISGYVNIPLSQLATRISEIPKDVFVVTA